MTAAPSRILLLALLAALACPTAAADAGQVTADSASYTGGADHGGDLLAFFLAANPEVSTRGALLSIDIQAGRLESLQIERRFIVGPEAGSFDVPNHGEVAVPTVPIEDPRFDPNAPPARHVLDRGHATLVAQQEHFQVHVIPSDPGSVLGFTARTDAGQFEQYPAVFMDAGRFEEPDALDVDERLTYAPEFWSVRIDEPVVVHDDQASRSQALFMGDMVLEIVGGTFEARDREKQVTLESGEWTTSVGGEDAPRGVDEQRRVLLRMFLQDAHVRIGYQGGATEAYWASRATASEVDGVATLDGASGEVSSSDGLQLLDDDRYQVPPGTVLTLAPSAPAMTVGMQPAATTGATAGGLDNGHGTALVGVVAALALLAAIAIGVLQRARGAPELRDVELALEAERYGRAARIAKRILRVRPGLEDAVLGRAIALSKAGRAGAAISEIHEHLAARGASDGSLHYVLGLSFLDVGREAEAGIALSEAVRRTPALRADVVARLGQDASPDHAPTTLREVHGYA